MKTTYELMHKNLCAAQIDTQGHCSVYAGDFLPYDLYLEEAEDIDTLVNNVTNFYYWCATRVLTLDRQYAKEILNSIGASQAVTDRERAQIALSYRCVSLTDVFWVRREGEQVCFEDVNLYENHLSNAFVDIALRGRQMTANNLQLARDLSTNGCFPKAWLRTENGFQLLKDGGASAVENELLASRICQCFHCRQVVYQEALYDGEKVSSSDLMTSPERAIVSAAAFQVYAMNHDLNYQEEILRLDAYQYHMMNILDYLTGNTDRHWGNWGLWIDTATNRPVSLHPLMDFNRTFGAYDTPDGANCQPEFPNRITQRAAAEKAVRSVGLNQVAEVKREWFGGRESDCEMFFCRLNILKKV